jgi:hypothetical protein
MLTMPVIMTSGDRNTCERFILRQNLLHLMDLATQLFNSDISSAILQRNAFIEVSWNLHFLRLVYFTYFAKINIGLRDHHAVCVSVNFRMCEPVFKKPGMYIIAHEPISTACSINPSHQSMCLYVYSPIVARQRLGINITALMNILATIEELLDASSMRSMAYKGK